MAVHTPIRSDRFDRIATRWVESGRCVSRNQVLEAALDALEREEFENGATLSFLEQAAEEGEASGEAEDGVFARVRGRLNAQAQVSG